VSVSELEQMLQLIKRTSQDMYVLVKEEGPALIVQFQNIDNQISTITIYDEDMRVFAKVMASEPLAQTLSKLKKV
jgi:hypothetical protein